jgi:hypothetical protein
VRPAAVALLSVLACASVPADADACSCSPTTPCQGWGRSTAVFIADIVEAPPSDRGGPTRLRVVRAFKGVTESTVVSLSGSDGTCSLPWSAGERWMVYASAGPSGLRSTLCSGSRKLKVDGPLPDLKPEPGVVDGWLLRPNAASFVEPWIEGARVWIDTPQGRIASQTGEQGRFRLGSVPTGRWTVDFALGAETASAEVDVSSPDRRATVLALAQPAPR